VSTPTRILAATAHRIATGGAAELTLQEVAEAAGVSKALIAYHFSDKTELLARTTEWLCREVVARERAALDGVAPAQVVDALWTWIDGELARGDVRVLLALAQVEAERVRDAARAASESRRATATRTVARLFDALSLTPRVPHRLVADAAVALMDGLALDAGLTPERNRRPIFDAFWLAMLSLAE
jgi:AcrR family transcriptional regulator